MQWCTRSKRLSSFLWRVQQDLGQWSNNTIGPLLPKDDHGDLLRNEGEWQQWKQERRSRLPLQWFGGRRDVAGQGSSWRLKQAEPVSRLDVGIKAREGYDQPGFKAEPRGRQSHCNEMETVGETSLEDQGLQYAKVWVAFRYQNGKI